MADTAYSRREGIRQLLGMMIGVPVAVVAAYRAVVRPEPLPHVKMGEPMKVETWNQLVDRVNQLQGR